MTDTMPAWFWIPLAVLLWTAVAVGLLIRYQDVVREACREFMSAHFERALSDWRECRADYELILYSRYEAAADACKDQLVNRIGRRKGIDPVSLFMGNRHRAYAYATPELIEWWETHPRLTFSDYERQWMATREAEAYV